MSNCILCGNKWQKCSASRNHVIYDDLQTPPKRSKEKGSSDGKR